MGARSTQLRQNALLVLHKGGNMKIRAAFFMAFLFLTASVPRLYADCSGTLCTDCDQDRLHRAYCTTVNDSASCECSISVQTPEFCVLGGACTYTGGGGGGTGGGGTGGGSGCTRTPGEWCPADCSSCTTVFWY